MSSLTKGLCSMMKNKSKFKSGLTILELIIAAVIGVIVLTGVAVLLVDSQRGWNLMFNKLQSEIVKDSFIAKIKFDSVIRRASGNYLYVDPVGSWLEAYYYHDDSSVVLDRYAKFYVDNNNLNLEIGSLNPKQILSVETVCGNVSDCIFRRIGRSAQMILNLDEDSQTVTTVTSAYLHN
jgi:hypothetical protein